MDMDEDTDTHLNLVPTLFIDNTQQGVILNCGVAYLFILVGMIMHDNAQFSTTIKLGIATNQSQGSQALKKC